MNEETGETKDDVVVKGHSSGIEDAGKHARDKQKRRGGKEDGDGRHTRKTASWLCQPRAESRTRGSPDGSKRYPIHPPTAERTFTFSTGQPGGRLSSQLRHVRLGPGRRAGELAE